jgi:hypothetical protein
VQFLGTLNGALFLDAGNIWNISYPNQLSVGNWKVNSFLNEIALGTGIGLRWDFDYFLLRLDLASKMINPAMPKNEKWVFNKLLSYNISKYDIFISKNVFFLLSYFFQNKKIYLKKNDIILFGPWPQIYYHQIIDFILRLVLIKNHKFEKIYVPENLK